MIDKTHPDFIAGQEMYLAGVKYNDPKMVNNNHQSGWTNQERQTRCGFTLTHWSMMGGYKTSSDIRTLFV